MEKKELRKWGLLPSFFTEKTPKTIVKLSVESEVGLGLRAQNGSQRSVSRNQRGGRAEKGEEDTVQRCPLRMEGVFLGRRPGHPQYEVGKQDSHVLALDGSCSPLAFWESSWPNWSNSNS